MLTPTTPPMADGINDRTNFNPVADVKSSVLPRSEIAVKIIKNVTPVISPKINPFWLYIFALTSPDKNELIAIDIIGKTLAELSPKSNLV